FNVRQFSLLTAKDMEPGGNNGCGQFGPASVACNVVVHSVTNADRRQRKGPISEAANGTPRYIVTPFVTRPQIRPSSTFTRLPSEHAGDACNIPARARSAARDVEATAINTVMATTPAKNVTPSSLILMLGSP